MNEALLNKVLRCLNYSWKPKVTIIYKVLSSITTLLGKLREHEIELNILAEREKSDRSKKSFALEATNVKDIKSKDKHRQSEYNEDMYLIFLKFNKFLQNEKHPPNF